VTGERVLLTSGERDFLPGMLEEECSKQVAPLVGRDITNLLLMKKKPGTLRRSACQARRGYQTSGKLQ